MSKSVSYLAALKFGASGLPADSRYAIRSKIASSLNVSSNPIGINDVFDGTIFVGSTVLLPATTYSDFPSGLNVIE